MKLSKLCLVLLVSIISGCTTLEHYSALKEQEKRRKAGLEAPAEVVSPKQTLHSHTIDIAQQLFQSANNLRPEGTIAVGSFTMVDTLKQPMSKTSPTYMYGLQIAESLATVSVQLGLSVVEFKALPAIQITESHDLMLSRNLSLIKAKQGIDYFLTGTLVEQEEGLVVNARLIEVGTNIVIAAATEQIPSDLIWQKRKAVMYNGVISRTSY